METELKIRSLWDPRAESDRDALKTLQFGYEVIELPWYTSITQGFLAR